MNIKNYRRIAIMILILASSLACNFLSSRVSLTDTPAPTQTTFVATANIPKPTALEEQIPTESEPEEIDSEFPLPDDVSNFQLMPNGGINYQTDLTMEEVIAFYRDVFTQQGLTERTLNTAISANTFSLVFDGSQNGLALVIQGVSYGPTGTNVNIRYEEI